MCFPYSRTSELDKVPMTSEVFRRSVSKHFKKITNKNSKNQPHSRAHHYGIRCRQLTTLGGETRPLIHIIAFLSAFLWFPSIPLSSPCSVFDSSPDAEGRYHQRMY